jgi:hypothetical protein
VWGLDLVGPLQKAPGGYTHLLVAIDKFSKWIKVRPLNSIRSEQAVAFFTNSIHRFRVPNSIITDNGTQFTSRKFLNSIITDNDDQSNRTNREDSLDQLEEARDVALLHSVRYHQSLRRYHARGVRSRDLQVGDLVLRL